MRIQLDFDELGVELVEELQRLTGCRTYKDLFNNAISLLDWSVRQRLEGRKIISVDARDGAAKELVMPVLQHAAQLGEREAAAAEPALSR